MCAGVRYVEPNGKVWNVYFPSPAAALPVLRPQGVEWVKWGRRNQAEEGKGFLVTGWARWASVQDGKWDKFSPELVTLAARQFMEKERKESIDPAFPKRKPSRRSFWFDIEEGKAIQALVAHVEDQQRLYVVTDVIPAEYGWLDHDRWPRLVTLS